MVLGWVGRVAAGPDDGRSVAAFDWSELAASGTVRLAWGPLLTVESRSRNCGSLELIGWRLCGGCLCWRVRFWAVAIVGRVAGWGRVGHGPRQGGSCGRRAGRRPAVRVRRRPGLGSLRLLWAHRAASVVSPRRVLTAWSCWQLPAVGRRTACGGPDRGTGDAAGAAGRVAASGSAGGAAGTESPRWRPALRRVAARPDGCDVPGSLDCARVRPVDRGDRVGRIVVAMWGIAAIRPIRRLRCVRTVE